MNSIFEELRKLPCSYCKFGNCYASHCLKRMATPEDELYACNVMELDMEVLSPAIFNYFEFVRSLK